MSIKKSSINYDSIKHWISKPSDYIDKNKTQYGIGNMIYNCLKDYDQRIAQIEARSGETATFANLLQRSVRTAIEMQNFGIEKGDIISICSDNHLNTVVPFYAALFVGAIMSPIDPSIAPEDNKYLLNIVKPKLIFVSEGSEQTIQKIIEDLNINCKVVCFANLNGFIKFEEFLEPKLNENEFQPYKCSDHSETVTILFSSGTTGLPKGICLPQKYFLRDFKEFDCDVKIVMYCTNIYWGVSVFSSCHATRLGITNVVYNGFDPDEVWFLIKKRNIELLMVNTICLAQMSKTFLKKFQSCLKDIYTCGSIISARNIAKFQEFLPNVNICAIYGTTEVYFTTAMFGNNYNKFKHKTQSSGLPLAGVTIKVVDIESGQALSSNQYGEIRVKTEHQMTGYYKKDSSDCWDEEGFLKTGDWGYYDEDLCFYVTDRIKEMFKYKSWHILPAKLEAILETHPDVQSAAVIGIPHEEDDNHAMAIIIINENSAITELEIEEFLNNQVDEINKLRAGVKFVTSLPYTVTGKLKRRELKKMILNQLT